MSEDGLGPVLSAQPWRLLCALYDETPQEADPILRADEQFDSDAYVTLCYELRHALLPELAADGLVEVDTAGEIIWRGPQFGTVRPLLTCSQEQLQSLDAGPFAYDNDSDTVRYDPEKPIEQLEAYLAAERTESTGDDRHDEH